jgi:hypothetical protein
VTFKPRHSECRDCQFFNPIRPSAKCLPCGAGEFFKERVEVRTPDLTELMTMFRGMSGEWHDDDE